MLTHHIAAHPRAPERVLRALADDALAPGGHARDGRAELGRALARNPVLPRDLAGALVLRDARVARDVFAASAWTPEEVVALFPGAPPVAVVLAALGCVPDPGGDLAGWAVDVRPDSRRVVSHVMGSPGAPALARRRAARVLAGDPYISTTECGRVGRFVREVLVQDYAAGCAFAELIAPAGGACAGVAGEIEAVLALGEGGPAAGTGPWFTDPGTTAVMVAEWAREQGAAQAWTTALRECAPDAALAGAGLDAYPRARWGAQRIVSLTALEVPVRERAARLLVERGSLEWALASTTGQLLGVASAAFVTWFLTLGLGGDAQVAAIAERAVLTGAQVEALHARQRTPEVGARSVSWMDNGDSWALWLAMHAATPVHLRVGAARKLVARDVVSERLGAALAGMEAGDGASVVRAGRELPISVFNQKMTARLQVTLGVLGGAALGELLGGLTTPTQWEALVTLLPRLNGTVGELFDVARAVAA